MHFQEFYTAFLVTRHIYNCFDVLFRSFIQLPPEAVADKVQKTYGFSIENEKVMRSPSLSCNVASLARERPCGPATIREECRPKFFPIELVTFS